MDAQNALAKSRDVQTTSSKFILHFSSNISRRMKPHIDINVKSKATNSIWRYQYSGLSTLYVTSILFRGTSLARSCKSPRYFHDTQFWLISRLCVYHIGTKELSLSVIRSWPAPFLSSGILPSEVHPNLGGGLRAHFRLRGAVRSHSCNACEPLQVSSNEAQPHTHSRAQLAHPPRC
jgi:hypothetical protein